MIFFFIPLCEAVFWYPNLAEYKSYTIGWAQNEKVPVFIIILNIFEDYKTFLVSCPP